MVAIEKSKEPPSAFLDSNVIANWVIVSSAIKIKEPIDEKIKKDLLKELSTPIIKSYKLLEKMKNMKLSANTFFTSNIAFSEVFSVIGDEWRAKTLYKKGVPMRYWGKMINDIDLSDEFVNQINEEVNNFYEIFFETGKIEWALDFNYNDVGFLIFNCKCNTHDAIVLTEALMAKCEYFVTEDQRLRSRMKKKGFKKINLISSDDYLRQFFK